MKKKIINGILLVAMLFAATTSFVSCKDNVDDEILPVYAQLAKQKSELSARIDNLEGQISSLQSELSNVKADVSTIKGQIATLQSDVNDLKGRLADVEAQIATLSAEVDTIKSDLAALTTRVDELEGNVNKLIELLAGGMITEIAVNHTVNDLIGSINVPGLNVKALCALFGENLTYIEKFPVAGKDYNVDQEKGTYLDASDLAGAEFVNIPGDFITKPNGNAGKLFFTANSLDKSLFDINEWTLSMEASNGQVAPITFSNIQPSSYKIQWGLYKSQVLGSNLAEEDKGFYEADAQIDPLYLEQCKFNTKKYIDLKDLKDRFKTAVENIKAAKGKKNTVKAIAKEAAQMLINFYSGKMSANNTDLNNPTWSAQRLVMTKTIDDTTVRFQDADLDVALTAMVPLSYNSFWEYEKNAKAPNLDTVEKAIKKLAAKIKSALPEISLGSITIELKKPEIGDGKNGYVVVRSTASSGAAVTGEATIELEADIFDPLWEAIQDGLTDIDLNEALQKSGNTNILGNTVDKFADRVSSYLERASNKIVSMLNNHQLTRAISPIILFNGAEGIDRLYDGITVNRGIMQIMMTSPTEELLVPACRKYIAVTGGGKVLQSANVPGNTQEWFLDLTQPGNYYVILSCVDYSGYVVTKKYEVHVI